MKLLLTSQGITTHSIADALIKMVGKSPYDTKVAFVPTARNAETPRRGSFIGQWFALLRHGFNWIDLVDPSADGVDWRGRMDKVDVVFVCGGNTFHLLDQTRKTGFDKWLKENLDSKVYVGVSAGSILATPTIEVAALPPRDHNFMGLKDLTGLNLVDFEIEPHCGRARFAEMKRYTVGRPHKLYALDDHSAVKVVDGKVEVVSDGSWELLNP